MFVPIPLFHPVPSLLSPFRDLRLRRRGTLHMDGHMDNGTYCNLFPLFQSYPKLFGLVMGELHTRLRELQFGCYSSHETDVSAQDDACRSCSALRCPTTTIREHRDPASESSTSCRLSPRVPRLVPKCRATGNGNSRCRARHPNPYGAARFGSRVTYSERAGRFACPRRASAFLSSGPCQDAPVRSRLRPVLPRLLQIRKIWVPNSSRDGHDPTWTDHVCTSTDEIAPRSRAHNVGGGSV